MAKKDQAFGIVPIYIQAGVEQFLLVQHHAGHWSFPKGHAEAGESAIETACREFEEETGIRSFELIGTQSFCEQYHLVKKKQAIDKTVTYFVAQVRSQRVTCQATEIRNYAWLPFQEALAQITFEPSKQVLRQVWQYLREHENP